MKSGIFITLLAALAASSFALADDQWYTCGQDDQCVIITGNCGVAWAANKDFADVARKYPPRPGMPCTKPREFHPANTVAKCAGGKCILSPPGTYAGGVVDVEQ